MSKECPFTETLNKLKSNLADQQAIASAHSMDRRRQISALASEIRAMEQVLDHPLYKASPALLDALEDLLDVIGYVDKEEWAKGLVRAKKVQAVDNAVIAVAKANGVDK